MPILVAFFILSVPIVWFSLPSLRDRHTHGFYRFFAFEILLLQILTNIQHWFVDPFAIHQIVSWVLLCGSLALALHGFYLLRVIGQPQGDFEKTTRLVIVGAYKYIRHPLYGSLLYLSWGVFFKDLSLPGALMPVVVSLFLYATARMEESENTEKFGSEYIDYAKSTRMFVPFVF